MGHLTTEEGFQVIAAAIRAASENIGVELKHRHTTIGNLGYFIEITDTDLLKDLIRLSRDYQDEDYIMSLNIPMDYFDDDACPEDFSIGVGAYDATDVKAEIRCINLIQKTFARWEPEHRLFTGKDLMRIFNIVLEKLRKVKNMDLDIYAGTGSQASKTTDTFFSVTCIWDCIKNPSEKDWFNLTFDTDDYYKKVGDDVIDTVIGISNLKGKSKEDVCLLRIAYITNHIAESNLSKYHKDLHTAWKAGKL